MSPETATSDIEDDGEEMCPFCEVELVSITMHGGRYMAKECPRCKERFEDVQ